MAEYRNSIRTKKAIKASFAELLSEKNDINKITVKELVERADISKSTFYDHYQDIYAVADEFEMEVINLLESILEDYVKDGTHNFSSYVRKLISLLKSNEDLYKKIFASDLPVRFIDRLKDLCNAAINRDVQLNFLSKDPDVRLTQIDFLTNGVIHLFVDYFKGKLHENLDQIGNGINNMLNMMISYEQAK
jgi:AcrR family transcriptional regulator